jgi:hypothetical protein
VDSILQYSELPTTRKVSQVLRRTFRSGATRWAACPLSNIGGVDHADATATMLARTASIARSRRGLAILKKGAERAEENGGERRGRKICDNCVVNFTNTWCRQTNFTQRERREEEEEREKERTRQHTLAHYDRYRPKSYFEFIRLSHRVKLHLDHLLEASFPTVSQGPC